jgi:ATP-binding cassette subfamily B protein
VLDESQEVFEKPDAVPLERAKGNIELRNLSFSYDEASPLLRNVSLIILKGARLGIAGRTGAGKTTLVSLLLRLYDPKRGKILLDGVDLRDYKLADLRSQFAFVLQEPVLFSASIAENIAYARPEANSGDIVRAAKAAGAHEFITRLPEGYETVVGERGMRLSGGERQRITIARAFLKNAPILVLDEPTSSVDIVTEAAIADALERLMKGRTTFVIAHRSELLDRCDAKLIIDEGRLFSVEPAAAGRRGRAGAPRGTHPAQTDSSRGRAHSRARLRSDHASVS